MTTVFDIYKAVDTAAPFSSAMDFDNVGILVGSGDRPVRRVMICLDITPDIVNEAVGKNVDLILSHHPVIFNPVRSLPNTSALYMLAKQDIAALCCHTNLDIAPVVGSNEALGKRLGLSRIQGETEYGIGFSTFSGMLPSKMTPQELSFYIKRKLDIPAVLGKIGSEAVEKLFFTSGAGGEFLSAAHEKGAKAFVTGELKHHEWIQAQQMDITVIAAGHFETEHCFADCLMPYLEREFPEIGFIRGKAEKTPIEFM